MSSTSTAYRADIDGLRALAVLSVAIFHLNSSWMPSGFLGVDIFFVLSGFLISTILYREISTGTFSYARFYIRRMRRILPAFFAVVLVSLVLGSVLFVAEDVADLKKSALASLFFGANIYYSKGLGYFDNASEEKPLLHIWSLSVEEQFYFLFPLILMGLIYLLRPKDEHEGRSERLRQRLLYALSGLCVLLLGSSFLPLRQLGIHWESYYLSYIRFGELLVGSILAVALADRPHKEDKRYIPWLGILSLVTLVACLFANDLFAGRKFPGPLALVPCGTVAVLLWANRQRYWLSSLFSWAPIVWIGKISYSLYLWHWVVLAFFRYYAGSELSPKLIVLAVVLMFVLSLLSYYVIEKPLRHKPITFRQGLVSYYLLPGLCVVFLSSVHVLEKPFPEEYTRYSAKNHHRVDTLLGNVSSPLSNTPVQVLIAGDSHAMHLFRFFDLMGKHEGWQAYASGVASDPFLLDYDYDPSLNQGKGKQRNDFLGEEYKKYNVIVLASLWGSNAYKHDPRFWMQIDYTIKTLLAEGKHVIMPYSCYERAQPRVRESYLVYRGILKLDPQRYTEEELNGKFYEQTRRNADSVRRFVLSRYPQVAWIDLTKLLPPTLLYEGMPVMADTHHLNDYGAEMLAHRYQAQGKRFIPQEWLGTPLSNQ